MIALMNDIEHLMNMKSCSICNQDFAKKIAFFEEDCFYSLLDDTHDKWWFLQEEFRCCHICRGNQAQHLFDETKEKIEEFFQVIEDNGTETWDLLNTEAKLFAYFLYQFDPYLVLESLFKFPFFQEMLQNRHIIFEFKKFPVEYFYMKVDAVFKRLVKESNKLKVLTLLSTIQNNNSNNDNRYFLNSIYLLGDNNIETVKAIINWATPSDCKNYKHGSSYGKYLYDRKQPLKLFIFLFFKGHFCFDCNWFCLFLNYCLRDNLTESSALSIIKILYENYEEKDREINFNQSDDSENNIIHLFVQGDYPEVARYLHGISYGEINYDHQNYKKHTPQESYNLSTQIKSKKKSIWTKFWNSIKKSKNNVRENLMIEMHSLVFIFLITTITHALFAWIVISTLPEIMVGKEDTLYQFVMVALKNSGI